jgi:two-component sensor histidine kinase
VLGLSLGLHELATNALKHGSLTVPAGRVLLAWTSEPEQGVRLHWAERGGPPPKPPEHQGFGTRLLQRGLPGELGPGSTVAVTYLPEGFEAEIRFRAAAAPP